MKNYLLIIAACYSFTSCVETLDIDTKHEPLLQVDAVFYANESLPLIEIKQSFEAVGTRIYEIPYTDLLIKGAEVKLLWNGKSIEVLEETLGQYRGQSADTIRMGDVFEIEVKHNGRIVTSKAVVPTFDVEAIRFKANETTPFYAEEVYTRDSIPDTVSVRAGYPFLEAVIPFVPDFMAFIWYSLDADEYEEIYQTQFFSTRKEFQGFSDFYLGENYVGFDTISIYKKHYTYFLDENTPTDLFTTINLGYELVIPEPIYAEYHTTYSSVIVPITVTNVEGGVGLFFGAIRQLGEVQISVPIEIQ